MKKKFSIVLPIYKNESNLPVTIPYILERLYLFDKYDVEIIMTCDGSPDRSYKVMKEYQRKYPSMIKIANFAKNSGQRAAVNCGMKLADGDVIGVISADLQDPFELFSEMLRYWEEGEKLVIACRTERHEKGIGPQLSKLLHRFINKNINKNYPAGGFDFFVVDRDIASLFIKADTKNNSMQLLLLELAGTPKQIAYARQERKIGSSGWNLARKIDQTLNIITVYSDKPFKIFGIAGIVGGFAGILLFILSVIGLAYAQRAALYLLVCAMGVMTISTVFFVGSVLGIYGFKGMENTKKIPRYIVTELIDETEE